MAGKHLFNKKRTRLSIEQAAKELFLEKRFSTITVEEIARRAGVTKRTVYTHFPSKLALFVHMFDEYLQELHARLLNILNENIPAQQLMKKLTDTLFTFSKDNEKFMRLFWTLGSDEFDGMIPEELVERIRMWNRAMMDAVIRMAKEPKVRELLGDHDPELLYHLMSAINKGIFFHTNKSDRFKIAAIDPEKLHTLVVELIQNGLAARSFSVGDGKLKDTRKPEKAGEARVL